MTLSLPLVLVPGLLCSTRLYAPQVEALWAHGPVMVADHRRDASVEAIAARILQNAPERFALAGLSLGGYIAFAIMRLAPERVGKLALLDTAARADTPEQSETREKFIKMAEEGKLMDIVDTLTPKFLHPKHAGDARLKETVRAMARETGVEAFVKQERAIIGRPDSRPLLASIKCPTLVLVGDGDELTPPDRAKEMADGIAGAKLVVVPECGHLSTIEQPDAVNKAMSAWLEA